MWWDVLDVDADAELRDIKRAYARKIKGIDQVVDREVFIEINQAYEQAKLWHDKDAQVANIMAYFNVENKPNLPRFSVESTMQAKGDDAYAFSIEDGDQHQLDDRDFNDPQDNTQSAEERLYQRMMALYQQLSSRCDASKWQALLTDLSIEESLTIQPVLQSFLLVHNVLPSAVWHILYAVLATEDFDVSADLVTVNSHYPDFAFIWKDDADIKEMMSYYHVRHMLYFNHLGLRQDVLESQFLSAFATAINIEIDMDFFTSYALHHRVDDAMIALKQRIFFMNAIPLRAKQHFMAYCLQSGDYQTGYKLCMTLSEAEKNKKSNSYYLHRLAAASDIAISQRLDVATNHQEIEFYKLKQRKKDKIAQRGLLRSVDKQLTMNNFIMALIIVLIFVLLYYMYQFINWIFGQMVDTFSVFFKLPFSSRTYSIVMFLIVLLAPAVWSIWRKSRRKSQ